MRVLKTFFLDEKLGLCRIGVAVALAFVLLGIVLRLFRINQNDFVFYDEGYYLNYNRALMDVISRYQPRGMGDWFESFVAYLRASLAGAKALWFLIVNARVYFVGAEAWFFPRIVSALAGILTLFLTFRFATRVFSSTLIGCLAVVFLAVLPSHVFYSRLGLQEALSTLLVLGGFYFYLWPARWGPRTFGSGLFFAAAFFSNYRLIVLPALVVLVETWQAVTGRQPWNLRKVVWNTLTFFACVFLIGNLDGGKNTVITFGWMFHQANLARREFDPLNFFSFPYYIFRLENVIFGLLFFGNLYYLFRRQGRKALPFLLVCLQMLIFSFASEKGARYICVMTPFLAMAAAFPVADSLGHKSRAVRWSAIGVLAMTVGLMAVKSIRLTVARSDYRQAAEEIFRQAPDVKFLSTQNFVQNLYARDPKRVEACPARFENLVQLYSQGYRYLVLCPQTYISWTENAERFNLRLDGYLRYVRAAVQPARVYPHFNELLLERFVFDHNENLARSLRFLRQARRQGLGQIRVYELKTTVNQILAVIAQKKMSDPGSPEVETE